MKVLQINPRRSPETPGKYGARQKGWGETGHGGVVVSLLGSDDGAWFRDLAKRKDATRS